MEDNLAIKLKLKLQKKIYRKQQLDKYLKLLLDNYKLILFFILLITIIIFPTECGILFSNWMEKFISPIIKTYRKI